MKRKYFILLNTDAAEGGATPTPTPAPATDGEKPKAATIVVEGKRSERELELETELERTRREVEEERIARVDRERTICEMQDKHENYRKAVESPKPAAPKKSNWQPLIGSQD